jgi:hypothetical protein
VSATSNAGFAVPVDVTVGPPPRPETQAGTGEDAAAAFEPVDDVQLVPEVDERTVRALLQGLGYAASTIGADEDVPDQWKFTATELDGLTPPLTRIINRRPKWRAAVARGDEAVVVMILASYGGRNVQAGREAKEARDELAGEDGRAAGPARAAPGPGGPGFAHDAGGGDQLRTAPGGGHR